MHELLEALNRYFAALPARLIAKRRAIWAIVIPLAAVTGLGVERL